MKLCSSCFALRDAIEEIRGCPAEETPCSSGAAVRQMNGGPTSAKRRSGSPGSRAQKSGAGAKLAEEISAGRGHVRIISESAAGNTSLRWPSTTLLLSPSNNNHRGAIWSVSVLSIKSIEKPGPGYLLFPSRVSSPCQIRLFLRSLSDRILPPHWVVQYFHRSVRTIFHPDAGGCRPRPCPSQGRSMFPPVMTPGDDVR